MPLSSTFIHYDVHSTFIHSKANVKTPVKNTFIHYDEVVEAPTKLRRVSSAPAEFRSSCEALVAVVVPAKILATNETVEDQYLAPARKKARVVSAEDENGIHSKQLNTDQGEDVNGDSQSRARGRSATRSCSRSQARAQAGGKCAKELSEQERLEKAKEWVSKMKETEGYLGYLQNRKAGDKKAAAAPRTPDPSLRITSKRKWERAIMSWRISLRRWGPVTVSAEDEA